jgi:hypothetical protein
MDALEPPLRAHDALEPHRELALLVLVLGHSHLEAQVAAPGAQLEQLSAHHGRVHLSESKEGNPTTTTILSQAAARGLCATRARWKTTKEEERERDNEKSWGVALERLDGLHV